MKRINDASPAQEGLAMSHKLRRRGAAGALLASLVAFVLVLPGLASANPLGEVKPFKTGLRSTANIQYTTKGSDGNLWFVDNISGSPTPAIGKVTPEGAITEYIGGETLSGLNAGSSLIGITALGKYLWFTDRGTTPAIGVIDSASPETAEEFSILEKGGNAESGPQGIVAGPDGNLWFTDNGTTKAIGVIDPSTHKVEEFSTGLQAGSRPRGIVVGSDGALWFTDQAEAPGTPAIGRIDPSTHVIEEFSVSANSIPGQVETTLGKSGIEAGPDGNIWFTETKEGARGICKIEVSEPHGITCFKAGLLNPELPVGSKPSGLTKARGKLWFTDGSGVNEKQVIKFEGTWATGNEFELCNEGKTKCSKKAYSTTVSTLRNNVKAAFEAIYGTGTVGLPSCSGTPFTCTVTFGNAGAATNFGQTSCEAKTGIGTCKGETSADGVPNAVGSITVTGKITRYPIEGLPSVSSITAVTSSDVWFPTGAGTLQNIDKFGIEMSTKELKVNKTGSGSGTVSSSPEGIDCGATCSFAFDEGEVVTLTAKADGGSEFEGWTGCESEPEGKCTVTMSSAKEVTAEFNTTGPTNLRTLTVTKSPSSSTGGGTGSVSSKPKGIKCGTTCDEAVARMYKESSVELTAKPSTGSTFVEWTGACSGASPTCTVKMTEDKAVGAVFGGTSKAFTPAEELTVSKGGSESNRGKGTVKAAGLGCEAECDSTTVLYQGPIVVPKPKTGKVVILKQAPAFGSEFVGWTGCDSEPEGNCQVTMETDTEVTAEYAALPSKTLTVNKSYAKGNGSVASKPKGIKCATTCTQAVASMPEGAKVELVAKPTTGTFVKWVGGDCNESTSLTCVVTMNADETTEAVFSDPGKAIAEAKTLTLGKDGSGFGTVKASGLTCEVLCTSTSALYTGPVTLPKPKAGKVVILKATSAPGSGAVEWTGCDSNPTPSECSVAMETDREITATFNELE